MKASSLSLKDKEDTITKIWISREI